MEDSFYYSLKETKERLKLKKIHLTERKLKELIKDKKLRAKKVSGKWQVSPLALLSFYLRYKTVLRFLSWQSKKKRAISDVQRQIWRRMTLWITQRFGVRHRTWKIKDWGRWNRRSTLQGVLLKKAMRWGLIQKAIALILIILLLLPHFIFNQHAPEVSAATYTWVQTNWSNDASASTAVHPTNQSNWEYYSSADDGISTSTVGEIGIATTSASWTDTTFSGATLSDTATSSGDVVLSMGSPSWSTTTIDFDGNTGTSVMFTSIDAIDADTIFVTYFNEASNLGFASSIDGGTTWSTTTIDSVGVAGYYSSLNALDANNLFVSYYEGTSYDLMFATSTDGGITWSTNTIDSMNSVGLYNSMKVIDANTIFVSYFNDTVDDLMFATSTDGGNTWTTTTIEAANDTGRWTAIDAIDANTIFIGYYDATGDDLEFASSGNGGNTWTTTTIGSARNTGSYTSIKAIDANTIFISYYNAGGTLGFASSTDGGTTWSTRTIDTDGLTGYFTSMKAIDANNIFISYFDNTNDNIEFAKYASTYSTPGTVESVIYDTTVNDAFGTMTWSDDAVQTITMKVRTATSSDMSDATAWGSCSNVTKGNDITANGCVTDSHRYVQYQATLSTGDVSTTPTLNDVTVNYSYYPTASTSLTDTTFAGATVTNMATSSGDVSLSMGAPSWSTTTIDTTGDVGKYSSIDAIDINTIFISYHDDTPGQDLEFASSTDGGTTWTKRTLDSSGINLGTYTSIDAIDANTIFISYADYYDGDLEFISSTDGATSWSTQTIDDFSIVAESTSIKAIDANNIFISYFNDISNELKFASSTDGGSTWTTRVIDSIGNNLIFTSIDAIDINTIFISYHDDLKNDLLFALTTDGGSTWTTSTIDSNGVTGKYTSMDVIDANTIFVSYYDTTNFKLKFASSVNGGATWSTSTIDNTVGSGQFTSISAIDTSNIFVSSYNSISDSLNFSSSTDGGATWTTRIIDETNNVGQYTSMKVIDANNIFISYYYVTGKDLEFAKLSAVYNLLGTTTSAIKDTGTGGTDTWGTMTWTSTTPANTDIMMRVRSDSDSGMSGATDWNSCEFVGVSGDDISSNSCVTDGHRYIQFQALASTTDSAVTPTLHDVTINYVEGYPSNSHTLISNAYDTSDSTNAIASIAWSETLPYNTDIQFQLRSAPDSASSPGTWTSWMGTDGTDGTYFGDASGGDALPAAISDATNDQWIQYKVFLTTNGTTTPTLSDVTISYSVNAPPGFDPTYGVSGSVASQDSSGGTVTVTYKVRDIDHSLGSNTPGFIAPSFEYSLDGGSSWSDITAGNLGTDDLDRKAVTTSTYSSTASTTASWDAVTQLGASTYETDAQIRVKAHDGEGANFSSTTATANFTLDTKLPVIGTPTGGGTGVNVNQNALTSLSNDKTNDRDVTLQLSATDDSTKEVIFSEASDFDGASYEAYASSKDFNLSASDEEKTVYARFRDQYGNTTGNYSDTITLDTTPPTTPANVIIQDISNPSLDEYRLFLNWQTSVASDYVNYVIYRSTDGVTYSILQTITNVNTNYITDVSLASSTTYYYKVEVNDDVPNSATSTAVSKRPGTNPTDSADPSITVVATSTVTNSSANITWVTDETANSNVYYSTDQSFNLIQGVAGYATSHDVTLRGLTQGTTYYFYVSSADATGNVATSTGDYGGTLTTTGADTADPNISSIATSSITSKSAIITWTTDESANSFVEYSTSNGFSTGAIFGTYATTTAHSVTLPVILTPSTKYYFKVRSRDKAGNEAISTQQQFSTLTSPSDTTPPVISAISSSSVAYNTATITWTTDESASSFVEFGQTSAYGKTAGQYGSSTSHSVSLPQDLLPATTYNFRVRSFDQSNNEAISSNYTFLTSVDPADSTAPTIANITTGEPTATQVTVTWTTNEVADSYLEYSASSTVYNLSFGSPSMTTTHSVTLSGLTPSLQYYFRVKSADPSGNIIRDNNSGNGYTFATAGSDSDPPIISDIQIPTVATNTATITFVTDKASDSFIEFGFDTSYGRVAGQYDSVTSHTVNLPEDLLGDITYHFRVRTMDSDSNVSVSQDYTFTTPESEAVAEVEDTVAPSITLVTTSIITSTSSIITWTTNELASSSVAYGLSNSYGATSTDTTLTTQHSMKITGLTAETTYYYKVISTDASYNQSISDNSSVGYTFTTPAEGGVTITETIYVRSWSGPSGGDNTPPAISSIEVKDIYENTVKVTWQTNEGATSVVNYGLSDEYDLEAGFPSSLRTFHSIKLVDLVEGTEYHFTIISADSAGNSINTADRTFITGGERVGGEDTQETITEEEGTIGDGTEEEIDDELIALNAQEEATIETIKQGSIAFITEVIKALPSNPYLPEMPEQVFLASILEIAPKVVSAPVISGEGIQVETGTDWVRISWTTDKNANSLVALVSGEEYDGSEDNPYPLEFGNFQALTTEHAVQVNNLDSSTLYHYQVRSKSQLGDWSQSTDKTFITESFIPQIVDASFTSITETEATIKWNTNLPTVSKLQVTNTASGQTIEIQDDSYLKDHQLTIDNLEVSANYSLEISATSEEGETISSQILPFSTVISLNPPIISQVRITNSLIPGRVEKVQSIISWQTDKPATSRVYFEQGISQSDKFSLITPLDTRLTTDHIMITTNLKPGKVYQYKVESTDTYQNITSSNIHTVLTPRSEDNVIDVIIDNLEESFGFLKRLGL